MSRPSKFELIVDRILMSDKAMYLGGATVTLFIIWTIWSEIM